MNGNISGTTRLYVVLGDPVTQARLDAALLQRWLRFHGPATPALLRDYEEAYYPSEPRWREAALDQSLELFDRGLRGVAGS